MSTTLPRRRDQAAPYADPAYWRHDVLLADEERALALRVRGGDAAARQELILRNQRLVVSIAKRHVGPVHTLADLVSVGNRGLMRAVDLFDPGRGVRFATYATRWVRLFIQRDVVEWGGFPIRLPLWANTLVRRYEREECRLSEVPAGATPRPAPQFDDVCRAMALPASWRGCLAHALRVRRAEYEAERGWTLQAPEDPAPAIGALREALAALLARLDPLQEQSIRLSFGLGDLPAMDDRDIGRRLGCSREDVRAARKRGLRRLRRIAKRQRDALFA